MSALFVAWRGDDPQHGWGPVGRLEHDAGLYRFSYTRGARTVIDFRPFPEMNDLERIYESNELFPLFANRLLSPSRQEYEAFLLWGGFDPDNPPDPIAILGVTEGIRQTDSIEVFPCPAPDSEGCYVNKFFLHGVRWIDSSGLRRVGELAQNERLAIAPEPSNKSDPNAVAVFTENGTKIGYVPRYLARDVGHLLSTCPGFVTLSVQRLNADAPLQQRVLCRMNACWPDNFMPCSGPAFEPIPAGLPSRCEA
jgi:hypothetical protein